MTKQKAPYRLADLETQRTLRTLGGKKVDLRFELEAKQALVTAGHVWEESDTAKAFYEKCELDIQQTENKLNATQKMPIYQAGWLQGYKAHAKVMKDWILEQIHKGDKAQEEIAKLEDQSEQEQLNKEKLREINEDFERLEKALEESEE